MTIRRSPGCGNRIHHSMTAAFRLVPTWVAAPVVVLLLLAGTRPAHAQLTISSTTGVLPAGTISRSLILGDNLEQLQAQWFAPVNAHQTLWIQSVNTFANRSPSGSQPTAFSTAAQDAAIAKSAALRWAMTGDAADLAKAVGILKLAKATGISGSFITEPEVVTNYLQAYDFIRGAALDGGDRSTIESRLLTEANALGNGNGTFSNARGKTGGTRGLAGVLLQNQSLLNTGLSDLRGHFNNSTTNDGWFTDSQGHYLNYTLPHIAPFVRAYEQGSGVNLTARVQPYADMTIGMRLPDGGTVNVSNGLTTAVGLNLLTPGQTAADRATTLWYLEQLPTTWYAKTNLTNNDGSLTSFFALTDFSVAARAPVTSPTFHASGQSGVSVFRNDWSGGSDFLMVSPGIDSPPTVTIFGTFAADHSHNDTGEILLAARGKYLLVAPGYLRTDLSNSPAGFNPKAANWHNVLLVNGDVGASDEGRKTRPGDFTHTNRLDSTEHGDFKGVADFSTFQTNYRNVDVRRSAAFVNDDYFVVADVMDGSAANTYTFNLVGRGTQTVLTDTPGLIEVRWQHDGAQVINHIVGTTGMTLATATLDTHLTFNEFEQTRRMQATMSATDGGFLSVLETGAAGQAARLAVTNLSTAVYAAAKVIDAAAGVTDYVLAQVTRTLRSLDDDALVSDGQFAYVRAVDGRLDGAMISRGTSLAFAGRMIADSTQELTASFLFSLPGELRATISADGFLAGSTLRFHDTAAFKSVLLNGSEIAFSNDAGFSSVTLTAPGELRILTVPEPGTVALLAAAAVVLGGAARRRAATSRLALLGLALLSPAWAQPAVAESAGYTVSVVSALTKVRRDEHGPVAAGGEVNLAAARGEGESVQLLVQATDRLPGVKITATPLKGPAGKRLTLELLQVGYVPITRPTPVGFGRTGPYPDPLLPLAPFDVAAGESQAVWVTCWVPRDAVPGVYKGRIFVRPRSRDATEIPVSVHVSAARLPVIPALRTSFDYWQAGNDSQCYGDENWKPREPRFLDDLRRYRLSTPPVLPWADVFTKRSDGTWTAAWETFDEAVERSLAKGAAFFMVRRHVFAWYGQEVPREIAGRDDLAAKLRLLDAHLEEKGWADRFGFYVFDEPVLSADWPEPGDTRGPENVRAVQELGRFLHEHAPHLRMIIVACDPVYESVAIDEPAFIWCPHINHFNAAFQAERQRLGEPNWMYVCMTTWKSSYPDIWRIDRPGATHRAVGSWLWRYGCDGFLYWCVDYWRKDPFETPDIFRDHINGDGFLFYPDPQKEHDPFPSIRAALTRDGFEDYELLTLVRSAAERVAAAEPGAAPEGQAAARTWLAAARAAMEVNDVILSRSSCAEESTAYDDRHRRLLDLLTTLEDDPALRRLLPAASP